MNVLWTKPTSSGLGDRLCDLLFLCALTRVQNATLSLQWPRYVIKDNDAKHRDTDIALDNVLKFLKFPPDIQFNPAGTSSKTFNFYLGAKFSLEEMYMAHVSPICPYDQYVASVRSVAKDFGFCEAINDYLKTVPPKFVSLHIRRSDKVRPGAHDNFFISDTELEWLDQATYAVIDHYINLGYTTFFVCGDEDHKTAPFADYIVDSGGAIYGIPQMEKWQATYYDLAVMTKSEHNITSQRHSSFSRFPALIGNGSFETVINLCNSKELLK